MFQFQKATKTKSKLRLAIIGPSGSGKTYSALAIASQLGSKIAVMDTERGSASKYADLFKFDVLEPDTFAPEVYIQAIATAEKAGYDVLVIDSLSHAWVGKDGALEMVDREAAKSRSGNSFAAWRNVTPIHNRMVDAIVSANMHVIATMRSKMEYVIQTDERGKQVPKKIGMQPVQRDGLEYEFDLVADMDMDNNLIVGKSRCPALTGKLFNKPGQDVADILKDWLTDGVDEAPKPVNKPAATVQKPQAPKNPQPAKVNGNDPWGAVDIARTITTKKGTPLGNLTCEQLNIIVEKETDGGIKSSAETLLGKPDDRHFTEFYALVGKADQSGMIPTVADPKDDICLGELRQLMVEIQNSLDAINTPAK